jgi:hypothetical protein
MSTRHDRNFISYDGEQADVSGVTLDPIGQGWKPGSWQDTAKFHKRNHCVFSGFWIVDAGTEDAVDIGTECCFNTFTDFTVPGGKQVLTLKAGSCNNYLDNWRITKPGSVVDFEFGNWNSQNTKKDTGNIIHRCIRMDLKPITWAARFGCEPTFSETPNKRLLGRCIGITIYWHAKYFWHKVLGFKD